MSFLKSLFGFGQPAGTSGSSAKRIDYNGFVIEAAPYDEGGQFQLAGVISKPGDDPVKQHRFVRADRFASANEAAERALDKGRQLVDEQGDKLFG